MSDETTPFTEWLDEFKGFLRDSDQKGYLYGPKIVLKRNRKERVKLDKTSTETTSSKTSGRQAYIKPMELHSHRTPRWRWLSISGNVYKRAS